MCLKKYEKTKNTLKIIKKFIKRKKKGEEEEWLSPDDVRAHFRKRANGE